jgi:hypothetical protein
VKKLPLGPTEQKRADIANTVLRLFGAFGRVPPDDAYHGYEIALWRFTPGQLAQGLGSAIHDGVGKDQPPNAGAFAAYIKPLPREPEKPWRARESWLNEPPPTQDQMACSSEELADAAARRFLAAQDAYDRHPFGSLEQDGARRAMDEARNEEQHWRRAAAFHREQGALGNEPRGEAGFVEHAAVGRFRP